MSRRRIHRHRNKREANKKRRQRAAEVLYLVPIAAQVYEWMRRRDLHLDEVWERVHDACLCCDDGELDADNEWVRWWMTQSA